MTIPEWIDWFLAQEKYDCVAYEQKIKVPWSKKPVMMGCLTTPMFRFGHKYMMPPFEPFSAS